MAHRSTVKVEAKREIWQREMRRLQTVVRLLGAALLALVARMIAIDVTPATAVSAVIVAALLIAALLLRRHGHRIEPRAPARRESVRR